MKHTPSPWLPICLSLGIALAHPVPLPASSAVSMMEEAVKQRSRGAQGEALKLLRQAVETSKRLEQQTLARLMLGDFLREAGKHEEARDVFTAIIESEAGTEAKAEASFRLAQVWDQLGQPEKGLSTARQLLKSYPDSDYAQLARQYVKSAAKLPPGTGTTPSSSKTASVKPVAKGSNRPIPVVEGTPEISPDQTAVSTAVSEPVRAADKKNRSAKTAPAQAVPTDSSGLDKLPPEDASMLEEAPVKNEQSLLPAPTPPGSKPARPTKQRIEPAKKSPKTPAPADDPEVAELLKSGRFDVIDPNGPSKPGKNPSRSSAPDDARVSALLGSGEFEEIGAEKPSSTPSPAHVEAPPADDEEAVPIRRAPGLPPREDGSETPEPEKPEPSPEPTSPEPQPAVTAAPRMVSAPAQPAPIQPPPVRSAPATADSSTPSDLLVYAPLPQPEQEALATTILADQTMLQKTPDAAGNDEVLFRLALNTARFGEHLEACRLFDQLLSSHASSPKVEEAYFEAIRLRTILRAFPSVQSWGATFLKTFPTSSRRAKVERLVAYAASQNRKPAAKPTKATKPTSRPAQSSRQPENPRQSPQQTRSADESFTDPASQALRKDRRYQQARTRLDQGHYALAMADLQGLSTEHPKTPLVWYDLALVQIQGKRITDAEQSLNRLLELQPENPEARSLMGYLHYHAQEYGRAAADYEHAGSTDREGLTFFDPEFAARRMEKSARRPTAVSTHKGAQE